MKLENFIRKLFYGSFLEKMIIKEVKEELGLKMVLSSVLFKEDISLFLFMAGNDLMNLKYIPYKKLNKYLNGRRVF